ncbi:MAG: 5-oxoprolinase subunit PxpA [Methylococcales bacterium]|jgi:5-oxoprolinase (ATP-hydrolysing) subunit A|nr:5-oxoprolinase subunit PxpA [Methylococcales bacterium]MBT7408298.1 5-oxoprolinase subunit PxpA [Methylococcales bacterium]
MSKIAINCDLGECLTPNPDHKIMPLIDMANIACGGHAGDDESMKSSIALAQKNKVKIGIHPSYLDKKNFGRLSHQLSHEALYCIIKDQIAHFLQLCHENNVKLEYIKPHGALYHDMMQHDSVIQCICRVIKDCQPNLLLIVQAGINSEKFREIEKKEGIQFMYEVFADRGYNNKKMISRDNKGAVLTDTKRIILQYEQFLNEQSFQIDTICFHSDNLASIEALKQLKKQ